MLSSSNHQNLVFSDQVVNQVLDELGIQMGEQMGAIPTPGSALPASAAAQPQAAALSDADADLQARLENLRRE